MNSSGRTKLRTLTPLIAVVIAMLAIPAEALAQQAARIPSREG
jgi:hypothetical protein